MNHFKDDLTLMEKWDAYDINFNKIDSVILVRGEPIPEGLFHLVCEIIVRHDDGNYLLMQRDQRKHLGGMWEATAGVKRSMWNFCVSQIVIKTVSSCRKEKPPLINGYRRMICSVCQDVKLRPGESRISYSDMTVFFCRSGGAIKYLGGNT